MPRGDKSSYTDKQKRKAEHIEEGYEKRGVPEKEAERRAWATVNKEIGRRQQERQRTRQAGHQGVVAEGRQARRARLRRATGGGALRLGEEGRRNPEAPRQLTGTPASNAAEYQASAAVSVEASPAARREA